MINSCRSLFAVPTLTYSVPLPAGMYQRQVAHVRLLGEAYSFRLVDSGVIFNTLHLLVAFGHDAPDTAAALDPPTSFFRIRRVPRSRSDGARAGVLNA